MKSSESPEAKQVRLLAKSEYFHNTFDLEGLRNSGFVPRIVEEYGLEEGMWKKKYEDMTDGQIIERIRENDDIAMEYLMEKYKNMIRKKANSLFLIGGDKDDLIQEGMIGLYKAIRDFDLSLNASFYSFADLCVSRQMYTAIKLSNRKKNGPLNNYVSFSEPVFGDGDGKSVTLIDIFLENNRNPEDMVIDRESTSMLQQELERRLSAMERKVLELYLGGKNYQEIAKVLGREPKSIDNALQRIKGKLVLVLEKVNEG